MPNELVCDLVLGYPDSIVAPPRILRTLRTSKRRAIRRLARQVQRRLYKINRSATGVYHPNIGGRPLAFVNLGRLRKTRPRLNDRQLVAEIIRLTEHEVLHHGIWRATRRKVNERKSDWAIDVMQHPVRWMLKRRIDRQLQRIKDLLRDAKRTSDPTKLRKVLAETSVMLRRVRQDLALLRKLTSSLSGD